MLNIQIDLCERLAKAFPDAIVKRFVPEKIPDRLITIRREGGRRQNNLIDGPGIGIFVFASTEIETSKLADEIADFMSALAFSEGYASVTQEVMYSAPDPDTNHPRWYLSYTIQTYEPIGDINAE